MILNIVYGSGMEVPLGSIVGDSNSMYGPGMEVSLGDVTGDSEHYVWIRN